MNIQSQRPYHYVQSLEYIPTCKIFGQISLLNEEKINENFYKWEFEIQNYRLNAFYHKHLLFDWYIKEPLLYDKLIASNGIIVSINQDREYNIISIITEDSFNIPYCNEWDTYLSVYLMICFTLVCIAIFIKFSHTHIS